MSIWTIEPRDRLILGDGRPKDAVGHRAASLDLPRPSTIAGAIRAKIGLNARGRFTLTTEAALDISVHGPLLRELDEPRQWLVPAPSDALWHRHEDGTFTLRRLVPRELPTGMQSDLPGGLLHVSVAAGLTPLAGKPTRGPGLWRWSELMDWLQEPAEDRVIAALNQEPMSQPGHGVALPIHDERIHVALEIGGRTALDGALYAFDGIRFQTADRRSLALTCRCDDTRLAPGILTLGGKRQQSFLSQSAEDAWPLAPEEVPAGDRWRVMLLTPAVFEDGFLPKNGKLHGQKVIAAAVGRPEGLHGWDMRRDERGRQYGPKPLRWMAPAGSVYWIEAPTDEIDRRALLEKLWLQPCSDDEQHRRDGLGLAVVGRA